MSIDLPTGRPRGFSSTLGGGDHELGASRGGAGASPRAERARDLIYTPEAFSRADESDDAEFYSRDRLVDHLDAVARATVERLIGELLLEDSPAILDLMASWDSHLPATIVPAEVVGLGLNLKELERNLALSERVIHDINREPLLPFDDERFDAVLNVVSVDYMIRPFEVFREVARVLKPGGLFLVVFSNRMFPQKAVRLWREASEEERVLIVEDYFERTGAFGSPVVHVTKGRPRPADDKYAHLELPSDPIYAVYADRTGAPSARSKRPRPARAVDVPLDPVEVKRREATVRHTLACPRCGERLLKWRVPQGPFTEWSAEFLYICFNDRCPYLLRGWDVMARQGNIGFSYRVMYNPDTGSIGPVPVPSLKALRENIEPEPTPTDDEPSVEES